MTMPSDILNNDEIDALLNAASTGEMPAAEEASAEGGLQQADAEEIAKACGENSAAIAESLNLCLERKYRVEVGEAVEWSAASSAEQFAVAGLEVIVAVGGTALVVLIPESMPLPEWYTTPGESEAARLQTLAMEWSMNLLPATLEAGEFVSTAVNNLYEDVAGMQPTDWAQVIPLLLFEENDGSGSEEETSEDGDSETAGTEPVATLWLVAAVTNPPFKAPAVETVTATPVEQPALGISPAPSPVPQITGTMRRVLKLPVSVSVQLASKKIEMGQLMSISPGALIAFNKPCEDLLDLYVNNCLYCRGEAIKIGEKFGMKINEIDSYSTQREKIL